MHTDVVVVGAGPCGLLTALLLGRQGINTVLLEKHEEPLDHPKAMGVSARSAEIFQQLGLLQAMTVPQMARPVDAVSQWLKGGLNGEILGQAGLPLADTRFSPCLPFHCPQPHIESVLRQTVANEPNVTTLYGAQVQAFTQDHDKVTIEFENHGTQATICAQYLVGADGDHSLIRRRLGIEREGPGELGRFLSVYFKAEFGDLLEGRRAYLSNVLGDDWFELFVAVNGQDQWLMHHYLEGDETAGQYDTEHMAEIVRMASGFKDAPVEVLSIHPWVMSPAVAQRWRDGRVFLVGDAAARVSPAGGLGMNNGLQSAHNLAWKLAHVLAGHQSEALLDSYEAERLPAARFTYENSSGNANEVFSIVMAALSGHWDQARAQIARSRRAGTGWGQDFGIVYDSGAVLPDGTDAQTPDDPVNDYIEQARPGHRAPIFNLTAHGHTCTNLDLSGYRFVAWLGEHADAQSFNDICAQASIMVENRDFHTNVDWKALYGIDATGGVLVRPDGYVCARLGH